MTRLMACGAVLALAGAAMAQDRPPPPPRDGPPPALRGPRVHEDRVPGMDGTFGEGRPDGRMGGGRVPPGALMAAIGRLRGDDAPDGLQLSAKQEAQFRALHEEMGSMRGGERGSRGGNTEAAGAQRRRTADRIQEVQTRAFAILNDKQKDFVKGEIDKARKDAEGRMDEQRLERKLRDRAGGKPGQPPPPPGAGPREDGPAGAPVPRERLRHIAELLGQLSPEEREQFLSRVERALEERAQRGRDGDAPRARDTKPGDKGDMDDEVTARPRRARPAQPPADQPERPRRNPPG